MDYVVKRIHSMGRMSHEAPVASHPLSKYGTAFLTGLRQSGYLALDRDRASDLTDLPGSGAVSMS